VVELKHGINALADHGPGWARALTAVAGLKAKAILDALEAQA
jgi:hypothetical protein